MSESREAIASNVHEGRHPINRVPPPRTFPESCRRKVHGETTQIPAFDLTTNDWNAMSAEALSEHQQANRLTDKEMARKIGCNDRTYENYRLGRTSPSSIHLLRSIAVIPELAGRVKDVCRLEMELDPRAQQAMGELVRAAMIIADAKFNRDGDGTNENA